MSTVAPEQAAPAAPQAPPPVVAHPRIVATRKLLTPRFGSLAFTISSGGLPYWEVLLFTDRSLVDPRNASKRAPSNFYSSRQEGGLRKAAATGDDVYLAPSAVLRGFVAARPKPSAIYFTVAVYADAAGSSPVFPEPPELLALDAPAVQVSPDFTPDTVDSVLGVRASKLTVVGQALDTTTAATTTPAVQTTPAPTPTAAPAPAPVAAAPAPAPVDPADDAAGGEDGYSYYAKHPDQLDASPAPQPQAAPVQPAQPQQPAAPQPAAQQHDDDYDDGYGSYDDGWGREEGWAGAQSALFRAEDSEPAPLLDEDASAQELAGVRSVPYRSLDEPTAATPAPPHGTSLALTIDDKRALLAQLAGDAGTDRYGAVNADGEYKGRFGPDDPAYHHHHLGLSFGIAQFNQESGDLGRLLTMMKQRDATAFARIFGEHGDELIAVTTAAGPPSGEATDGRSARTQPVAGADVWDEPWLSLFRAAGAEPAFQAAQNELAATLFVDPMLAFAGNLGLDTDRAVAILAAVAAQLGCDRAKQWVVAAAGPVQTDAVRQQALAALGFADVAAFQTAHGLAGDNVFGSDTHAALVGALRALGASAPIQLPSVDQMLDALVRRADADASRWGPTVKRLRTASGFTDKPYPRS